jgi:5'-phosphate synthase pdxT subunit
MTVGVVAIQGDFARHISALERTGAGGLATREVRTAEDLEGVDRVIIPGGESTTVGLLMQRFGLGPALERRAKEGMPIWGTCMGMILMASDIEDRPNQYSLRLLDVQVQRNAFGPQVHSFEASVTVRELEAPILGVFIRAPVVTRMGPGVQSIADYEGKVVGVRQGNLVGTSFHPELTPDTRLHEWFLGI